MFGYFLLMSFLAAFRLVPCSQQSHTAGAESSQARSSVRAVEVTLVWLALGIHRPSMDFYFYGAIFG